MGAFLVLLLTAAVVAVFLSFLVQKLLYVSAPNEAIIFSGRMRRVGSAIVGYRVIRGGRALRVPFFEVVDKVDLTNIAIDLEVKGAYSKGGIPLNVHGVANIKLPGEEPLLNNAIERFLGRTHPEILRIAKETLEGNVRGVLALLTPEEVNQDKTRFAQTLLDEAEHDMNRVGLILDTLKIQNITDDVNYLNSIGRIQGARVRMDASIAEARAKADAAEQQALNWGASEQARIDADLAIAQQETAKQIGEISSRRLALIAEAEGQVQALVAQVKAEIERQKARTLQVKRKLEADVVRPAEAAQQAAEERARGDAAAIVERGRAEAEAFKAVFAAYSNAGPAAKSVLALQQLLPILSKVAGIDRPLVVGKITVLPSNDPASGGRGENFARSAIGAMEQIKAATGFDLAAMGKKLSAPPEPETKAAPSPALVRP
jgi:flotillin